MPVRTPPQLQLSLVGYAAGGALPTRATLRRWVLLGLEHDARIALVFVGTKAGREMNRNFRGRDYATNVLTFVYEDVPRAGPAVSADVVLCLPVVRREAREQRKTLRAHLAHLVLHGVLHAQGHGHETRREATRMQALETALLGRLRIADPYQDIVL